MAAVVIWFYHKSRKASERREDDRIRRIKSRQQSLALQRNASGKGNTAPRTAVAGKATPDTVWSARQQRARKKVKASPAGIHEGSRTYQASYLGSQDAHYGAQSIHDQDVSKLDYVGFDEYIARQRKEAAEADSQAADEFSMTAMKYESQEESEEKEESTIKRAGFKP